VSCGVGNVAILGAVFGSAEPSAAVKVLAHYQTIGPWRMPREDRRGPAPRVWISAEEVTDVFAKFAEVKLTPEPVIEISGASGVPLIVAMATGKAWQGHAPGVGGLPGGYPAALRDGALDLDLPPGLSREEAVEWNARFERENGLALFDGGKLRYTGVLEERLREVSPDLAAGFQIGELDQVHEAMVELRARLQAERA
jgi:hypothetical protein